jgi:hypothetical protein
LVKQPEPPVLFDATDGSTNYLRTLIPANPVIDSNSSNILNAANLITNIPSGALYGWGVPIYNTKNTDPVYNPSLTYAADWGCTVGTGGIHIPDYGAIEPADFPTGDNWIVTVNTDTAEVKAIWMANKSSGTWSGACAGNFPLHGNGFNVKEGIGTGSGSQMGAGQILITELQSGHIDHALYMTSTVSCTTYRAPAVKSDGKSTASTCFPMGTRVQLDPSVNCNTLSGVTFGEKVICKTMQTYGAYVLDSGGGGSLTGFSFQGDDMTDPNRVPWQKPGDGSRGARNCAPVSSTCGVYSNAGLIGAQDFVHIPWNRLRILRQWDGK